MSARSWACGFVLSCSQRFGAFNAALTSFYRLSYLELCQMVQLLRPELQAPQIAQVAKDFMIFAFECADRSSIGNPEDECLEFPEFFAVASQIPGVGHALSVDVSAVFEAEKAAILSNLAAGEAKQAEPDAADKKAKKADAKSE